MKKLLLWIWQLPQNILGFILSLFAKCNEVYTMNDGEKIKVYYSRHILNCGVSLGDYIILDYDYYYTPKNKGRYIVNTLNHEHGHQKQSRMLGWLYLLIVGFTSAVCNNLWDRLFHKKWTELQRTLWYYNRFPEKWADRLGQVKRW